MKKIINFNANYIKDVFFWGTVVSGVCAVILGPLLLYYHVPRFLGKLAVGLNSNWKLVMLILSIYMFSSGIMYCNSFKNKLLAAFVSIVFCSALLFYYPCLHSYLIRKRIHSIVTKIEWVLNNKNMSLDFKKDNITKVIYSSFPAGEFETFYDDENGCLTTVMMVYKRPIFKPNDNIVLRYSSSREFLSSKFNIWSIPIVIKPNWQFFYHRLL